MIFLIFFIICIRRSAPIEDEDDEPTPEEEEEELREEPVIGDSERTCLIFQTQYLQGGPSGCTQCFVDIKLRVQFYYKEGIL